MTATHPAPVRTSAVPPAAPRPLAGTATLIRFVLRRDRLRLPLWLAGLTAATVATAASLADLYPTAAQRQATAESLGTPAGLAMSGPSQYLTDYNLGSMMSHQMLGVVAVLVGVMSVLLVVRHTRAEEESGRAELVRSSVVGRHAHLTAALTVVVAANLALAVLLAVGLGALGLDGVTWSGAALYGAAHAAVGLVFAGVATVTLQVTEHSRGASGLGLAAIAVAYVLRAVGDASTEALSWASPIGWAQATYAFVDDRWWPLLLAVAASAALVAAGLVLSTRRDFGAGLRQSRPGPAAASTALGHPLGLALRLHRSLLAAFAVAALLLGVAYGSVLGEVEQMLDALEGFDDALAAIGGATLVESFASMVMVVLAVIVSIYTVLAVMRPRSEETSRRAEPLLATAVSRTRWLGSHLLVAMLGSAIAMALAGFGLGVAGALVLDDAGLVVELTGGALAYVPALWVVAGLAAALYGLAPRAAPLVWALPVYAFVVGYLGQLLQLPDWVGALSPFEHVPQLPAEDLSVAPLLALLAVAAVLVAVGVAALRRRDLTLT